MRRFFSILLLAGAAVAVLAAILITPRVGHPVTPWMSQAATAMSGTPVKPEAGLTCGKPTVSFFILPGCPCSEAYESFTHELFRAYGMSVNFVGVVAGDEQDVEAWRSKHNTPFPLIQDPDHKLARAYGAKRSAYTVLITEDQTINRVWPGYSAEMLREVGALFSATMNTPEVTLEVGDAPSSLTSGCILE